MKTTKTIAAVAMAGAVTLSPMLALADTGADVSVNADAQASTSANHSFIESIKARFDAEANSSTTLDHQDGMKAAIAAKKADIQAAVQAKKDEVQQKHASTTEARGEKLVDTRISILQKLEARINDMKRLTSDEKSAIVAQVDVQIAALTSLKSQISSDASTTTLVADLKTIRPDYRTYLLVLPRTAILAAGNRVLNIVDQMTTEGSKLQTRITAAQNSGMNVSAAQAAYADYTSKIADAKVQGQAAIDLVKDLQVDQGDTATLNANTAALKSARTKLEAARADLKAARKDMSTIMQTLKVKGSVTASTTAETNH